MIICRIVSQLDFGGVEERLRLTSLFFSKQRKFQLHILVLGNGGYVADTLIELGISVTILNKEVKIPNVSLIFSIKQFLHKYRPNIVHTSGSEANFHGIIAAKLSNIPYIIGEEIGFPNHDYRFRLIFKLVYFLADRVIAISEAVKNRIVNLNEVSSNKVEIVYNPVNDVISPQKAVSNDFILFTKNSHDLVFVTTCRLVAVKNLRFFLDVFMKFVTIEKFSKSKLLIVGDGPEKEKLIHRVNELGITKNVTFLGFCSSIFPVLGKADVFVLPSLSEGFSISLVEAMLNNLVVISTNVGGPSEIVTHGYNGFLVDPKSEKQWLETLKSVFNLSLKNKAVIGNRAYERAKYFSLENYGQHLIRLYTSYNQNSNTACGEN
ncbi:glycosyltransferase family 4 protein [Cyclobacterium marinum]|uniref:glycosyltransferase family 4 protein n=1 Tax=Cyclobacterium marinum TaxID=104 RepID=UPI0030D9A653|tara:strand:+ start:49360 stop:50493 length:1134 start_codon:yes stop_codon:yes gene_type:complete